MNKKLIAVLSMILVLCLASFAMAEEVKVPSKTTEDMVTVSKVVAASGEALPAGFTVVKVVDEAAAAELDKIAEAVKGGETVVSYFKAEEQIKAIAPEVDATKLVMNEFFPVAAYGYDETVGDVIVSLETATKYEADQKVFVLLGVEIDGVTEWILLDAIVNAEGGIDITFTKDVLAKINGKPTQMAILS